MTSKRDGGQNYNPESFIVLERLVKSFGRVEAGKVLWKIYNQDISWHIKRKILIAVLAFICFFSSVFSLQSPSLALLLDHKQGRCVFCSVFKSFFPNISKDSLKKYHWLFFLPSDTEKMNLHRFLPEHFLQ